jgi:hydroxymethylglutaryl-CoA lyase
MEAAGAEGLRVRGYVSCVVECPYDGPVAPAEVARVAEALWSMGCYEISLGDTIGRGSPEAVALMLAAVRDVVPVERLAGHFHDTSGHALENIEVALAQGVRVFDAAVGGLGGCPYAPGAAGNVATEAVHTRLAAIGYETGLDAAVLARAANMARAMRGAGQDS